MDKSSYGNRKFFCLPCSQMENYWMVHHLWLPCMYWSIDALMKMYFYCAPNTLWAREWIYCVEEDIPGLTANASKDMDDHTCSVKRHLWSNRPKISDYRRVGHGTRILLDNASSRFDLASNVEPNISFMGTDSAPGQLTEQNNSDHPTKRTYLERPTASA